MYLLHRIKIPYFPTKKETDRNHATYPFMTEKYTGYLYSNPSNPR